VGWGLRVGKDSLEGWGALGILSALQSTTVHHPQLGTTMGNGAEAVVLAAGHPL
jgi:hypothetical protein